MTYSQKNIYRGSYLGNIAGPPHVFNHPLANAGAGLRRDRDLIVAAVCQLAARKRMSTLSRSTNVGHRQSGMKCNGGLTSQQMDKEKQV